MFTCNELRLQIQNSKQRLILSTALRRFLIYCINLNFPNTFYRKKWKSLKKNLYEYDYLLFHNAYMKNIIITM